MKLKDGLHLSYCTNIHRGENWQETFDGLEKYTLAVRDKVASGKRFGIGLRLSNQAAHELSDREKLNAFRSWLDRNDCYVFTINGFPFGRFHGGRVKEQVFRPDWTTRERLDYTNLLFDLLNEIAPTGLEVSVSTLPGSHKSFNCNDSQIAEIRKNIWRCVGHIAKLSEKTGRQMHLGVEPEPIGLFENSAETVGFFERLAAEQPNDSRLQKHLGVNYDTCHFAIQYENPADAIQRFRQHGIQISKIHLSSALKVRSTRETCRALSAFAEDVYLHQVIARSETGRLTRYHDLDLALAAAEKAGWPVEEWRIHFHVPLHSPDSKIFATTSSDIIDLFEVLKTQRGLCRHFEIETYTWEVLPPEFRNDSVVTQIAREFEWCLDRMKQYDLAD
jgi:sugar phosphate isomerase/epimerase